jgi:hypothetical protein
MRQVRRRSPEEGGRKGSVAVEPCAGVMGLPRQWNEEDRFWFLRLVQDINQHDRVDRDDHAGRAPPVKSAARPKPPARGERRRGAREGRRGGR